jgi:hypothetical protein
MESFLKIIGATTIVICTLPFFAMFTAFFGYFAGWLFGFVFSGTWDAVHTWLSMPPQLTSGMFGAFLGMFAGRPERNRTARSFRQLRRFHHVINSDKVFGTHKA